MSELKKITDCGGVPLPVFATGTVSANAEAAGAEPRGSVWRLALSVAGKAADRPLPGQFYLLRAVKSDFLLGRPISLFMARKTGDSVTLEFLILRKGGGTVELSTLERGDEVQVIGPLGNTFPRPPAGAKTAIFGGGVGIAPVAGFASTLPEKSYDFFAAFRSGRYGLEHIAPKNLFVTTDDGSVGTKGTVAAAIDATGIAQYDIVYACGPLPMLAHIQKLCDKTGVQSWLSMENRMACGVGACLGCTMRTAEGNKRCCKDGPVFDGKIIDFAPSHVLVLPNVRQDEARGEKPDLSVTIKNVRFKNPVIAASGTFGYGTEYANIFDVNALGGICSKGLTLEAKPGNGGTRLSETPSGLINSIGLENPGIQHFVDVELERMLALKPVAIANLSGSSLEGYVKGAQILDKTDVPFIELNISCPNVKAGGMAFGMDCAQAHAVTKAVREATKKPLMVKLSPNAPDVVGIAMAVREAGADALSLVNTFQATAIDIETGRPVFDNIRAGLSGPAIKPIALRMCYDVVQAMNRLPEGERIPVVGLGGISRWQDAVEFIMAGCAAVQVGTATFQNPRAMEEIISGIEAYMARKGFRTLGDFRGIAQ